MKLNQPEIKISLKEFIIEGMLELGLNQEVLAEKAHMSDRNLRRYLSNDVKEIPDLSNKTYNNILNALQKTHNDFKVFLENNSAKNSKNGIYTTHGEKSPIVVDAEGDVTISYNNTNSEAK